MSSIRKEKLVSGEIYHVFNKSIAGYKIFNKSSDYKSFIFRILFYNSQKRETSFSRFFRNNPDYGIKDFLELERGKIVDVIAYCLMPTHFHLILKQKADCGISDLMLNLCDSYSRRFNLTHKRNGPLWQGRFKDVLVKTDEQLLHLTRYVHLNPSTSGLAENPEEWAFSSYREYLGLSEDRICDFSDYMAVKPETYREFVEDRIDYQQELARIKKIIIE